MVIPRFWNKKDDKSCGLRRWNAESGRRVECAWWRDVQGRWRRSRGLGGVLSGKMLCAGDGGGGEGSGVGSVVERCGEVE